MVLVSTQFLLVAVTTGIIAGTIGWSDATATTTARSALTDAEGQVLSIEVRMRVSDDADAQNRIATAALKEGFAPAEVEVTSSHVDDPGGGTGFVVWHVAPDVDQIRPEHLGSLSTGADRARALVASADTTGRGITHSGDLAPVAHEAATSWLAARSLSIVPLAVLAIVTVIGVVQVAGLLANARASEVHLLLARGARPRQLVLAEVAEATAVTCTGAGVGTASAWALLTALAPTFAAARSVLLGGGATALGIIVALAVTTGLQIRGMTQSGMQNTRVRTVAGGASLVLVAMAVAVSSWQLLRLGQLVVDGDDGPRADFLAAVAPAFALLGAGVVALVLFAPAIRLVELLVRNRRGSVLPLAAAQVSRRLTVQAVPIILTVLATGTATLSALFAGTAQELDRDVSRLVGGTDVRVVMAGKPRDETVPARPLSVLDVAAETSSPVWTSTTGSIGDRNVDVLVAPMGELAGVADLPRGMALPDLSPSQHGQSLLVPEGSSSLTVRLGGHLHLDPWEQEVFDLIHEFSLTEIEGEQYRGIDRPALLELAQVTSERAWKSSASAVKLEARLVVRDVATGISEVVRGGVLTLTPEVVADGEDPMSPSFIPATGELVSGFDLAPEHPVVVDAILIDVSAGDSHAGFTSRTLDINLELLADEVPLLGPATAEWTASRAIPLALAADLMAELETALPATARIVSLVYEDGESTFTSSHVETNRPHRPNVLDTTGPVWTFSGSAGPMPLRASPTEPLLPEYSTPEISAELSQSAPPRVPVALTPAAAADAELVVGDSFELGVLLWRVPATLTAIMQAVPGSSAASATMVDSVALSDHLAHRSTALPWPSELWIHTDDAAGLAGDLRGHDAVDEVRVTSPGDSTPVGSTAFTFQVAAAGSVVLALVGIAAAAATQLGSRRPEVATLRALGAPGSAQATGRAVEMLLVLVPAAVLGMASGWLAAVVLVPALARSAVPGTEALSPLLAFEAGPWMILLGAAIVCVTLIVLATTRVVASQARDRSYREEVR